MTQRRKPINNLTGNHGKDRLAEVNPVYENLNDDIPDYLDKYAVDIWNEYYPILVNSGALKQTDLSMFVTFCVQASILIQSIEQLKQGLYLTDKKGKVYLNPAEKEFRYSIPNFIKIAVEMGLSPKARAGVVLNTTDQISTSNKLAKLLQIGNVNEGNTDIPNTNS